MSAAACARLNTASARGTSLESIPRASAVRRLAPGMKTHTRHALGNGMRVATGPPASGTATVKAPYKAAATLSACPSTSLAMRSSERRSSGSPRSAFAATAPPTIAAALEPRPRATGMAERCVTCCAGTLARAAFVTARAPTRKRLSSPSGTPAPFASNDQLFAGRSSNSASSGSATANESKPGPRFALDAGTRTFMPTRARDERRRWWRPPLRTPPPASEPCRDL